MSAIEPANIDNIELLGFPVINMKKGFVLRENFLGSSIDFGE